MGRENTSGRRETFTRGNGRVISAVGKGLSKSIVNLSRTDGEMYTGEWHNNHYHGQGVQLRPNGDEYEG
jgi:hypothetical protein